MRTSGPQLHYPHRTSVSVGERIVSSGLKAHTLKKTESFPPPQLAEMDTIHQLAVALTYLTSTLTQLQVQQTQAYNAISHEIPPVQQIYPNDGFSSVKSHLNAQSSKHIVQSQAEIRSTIVKYAKINQVSEVLSLAIAECESGFVPTAKSKESSAKGLFQFLDSTRERTSERMGTTTFDPFDVEAQANAGTWLLKNDGTRHWLESKPCWSKKIKGQLAMK